jgi:hypothetical protein
MKSMNQSVAYFAYRLLLRMHPSSFRDEFGAEMLWIFEEECRRGAGAYLLVDGISSLLRHTCRIKKDSGQLSITSAAVITGPGIAPVRFLQAGITLSLFLFSMIMLASPANRLAVSVRWSDRVPCYTISLQMPSHAEVVSGTTE